MGIGAEIDTCAARVPHRILPERRAQPRDHEPHELAHDHAGVAVLECGVQHRDMNARRKPRGGLL